MKHVRNMSKAMPVKAAAPPDLPYIINTLTLLLTVLNAWQTKLQSQTQ